VQAAARLARSLPERERLLVEGYEALLVRRDESRALERWGTLLKLYPTFAEEAGLPGLMADTLHQQGRWSDLILLAEAHVDAPSLPPGERARLSSLLARAYRRKGELERALEHARRAVQLWPSPNGPEFLWQRTQLGRIALEAGRRDEALGEFRQVTGAQEAEALNLNDAAWGFYMADETDEAVRLVGRALEQDPGYGNAYHLRGWIALGQGRLAEAARDLETAFERTPRSFGFPHQGFVNGDLAALYYAGVASAKLGQASRARALFERVIALSREGEAHPASVLGPALRWQAASFRARAAARLGHPAVDPGPLTGDDTTFFVQSARLHAVQGRSEVALEELAKGLALGHGEHRHIRDDPDFETLRGRPEFTSLLARPGVAGASEAPR
jgi:tetratricopeptide (TPR) repeat protein